VSTCEFVLFCFEIKKKAHRAPPDAEASISEVDSEPWFLDLVDSGGNIGEKFLGIKVLIGGTG
jgi:hypothetical protein